MECLVGAAYTKQVQAAGLAGPARPAMGRLDADFTDWRIGRFSHHAQLWVDRNFALMDAQFDQLRTRITQTIDDLGTVLDGKDARLLFSEYTRWASDTSWKLINAADPCGT